MNHVQQETYLNAHIVNALGTCQCSYTYPYSRDLE